MLREGTALVEKNAECLLETLEVSGEFGQSGSMAERIPHEKDTWHSFACDPEAVPPVH